MAANGQGTLNLLVVKIQYVLLLEVPSTVFDVGGFLVPGLYAYISSKSNYRRVQKISPVIIVEQCF